MSPATAVVHNGEDRAKGDGSMNGRPPVKARAADRARDAVRELIVAGVFPPHEKLPGERDLAERVKVSRTALREGLAALQNEGLVESSPWRGWFVAGHEMSERVQLASFTEMARERGLTPSAHVLSSLRRPASYEESAALAIAPGAEVLEVHRLRGLDGVPTCLNVSVIPLSRAPGVEVLDLEDVSMYSTLEERCGVRVVRCDYVVHAEGAGPDAVTHLELTGGTPVLIGEEVAYDAAGAAIVLARTTYRAESYRFRASLFRPAAGSGG